METLTEYKLNVCPPEKVKDLTVIHYGAKKYVPDMVEPVVNYWKNKPIGGLWTSPIDSKDSWREWCENEDYIECEDSNCFKLKFKPDTKVLLIDSMEDLRNLPVIQEFKGNYLAFYVDYEYLMKSFDAIWLTEKGKEETDVIGRSLELNRWDCECVFIMNKDCCYQVK